MNDNNKDNFLWFIFIISAIIIVSTIVMDINAENNRKEEFLELESKHEYFKCERKYTKFVGDKGFINGITKDEIFLTNGMAFYISDCEWLDEKDIIKGKMNGS